jgi:hypothetical protein
MSPKTSGLSRHFQYLLAFVAFLAAVIGWSDPSGAYVQQIVIDQTATVNFTPVGGTSTSYTIYQGRVFGLLSPSQPLNAIITDINLAPKTGGNVPYVANFQIVTPTNPAARNGLMIHLVPNRGGNAISTTALQIGVTYVQSGWQGDLLTQCSPAVAIPYPCFDLNSGPYGTLNTTTGAFTAPSVADVTGSKTLAAYVVQVPVATTDGNPPNGTNTITGPVYGHVCRGPSGCGLAAGGPATSTAQMAIQGPAFVPYQPVGNDTNQAQLWTVTSQTFKGVNTGKTMISSANWAWAYCPAGWPGTPNPNYICLKNGPFDPSLLYEVVYTAANPLVLGVGFAAFRDLGSFLRYGTTASGGGSNPIAGSITRAMSQGGSQSAAFLHGFIFYGFNQDEGGRIVFDGAWPQIDGRMMVMNIRWGQPNNLMYLYMGGDEAPVWWADYPNLARGLPANGMFHRCTATGTCPAVLETLGSAEIYSEKMHASLCGFTCVADIPLPSNVFRYYLKGATHGGGTLSFNWSAPGSITPPSGQLYPSDPIPGNFTNNALLSAFMDYLLNGTPMPPSVYPMLSRGELVLNTQMAEGFPTIPGFPYAGDQAWAPFVYDFGPLENYDQQSGIPTIQPPNIVQVLPVYAPPVDVDGNEVTSGLRSVLGEAPLGTYTGWNLTSLGWYTGQVIPGAGGSGAYWPFWDTKAHRMSNGDLRLSLEERYGTHAGYECVVRQAIVNAVAARHLLVADAASVTTLANSSNVLNPPYVPTTAGTSVANTLCAAETHDANGDGKSDIVWYNNTSGQTVVWLMNGTSVSGGASLGSVSAPWSIVGQRDFNRDGFSDLLWQNSSTGEAVVWLLNGSSVIGGGSLGTAASPWSIGGTGDFNGDGYGDVLWYNSSTGQVVIWFLNGTSVIGGGSAGSAPSPWTIVGTGDFNGDGISDILWRNGSSGQALIWFLNGAVVTGGGSPGSVSNGWAVAGTGDFNGDHKGDIAWRNTSTGQVVVWLLNGSTVTSAGSPGMVGVDWTIAQTGDFNGDGQSDILWRQNTGAVAVWLMNGVTANGGGSLGSVTTDWQIQGMNAD